MNSMDNTKIMEGEVLPHLPTGRVSMESLRRSDVVTAFSTAFQMIGGVSRLAMWGDENPSEFYKLYSRLLPSSASDEMNRAEKVIVIHALAEPGYNPHRTLQLLNKEPVSGS